MMTSTNDLEHAGYYDPNARYLHGSKQQLQGTKLTRNGKNGVFDAGALFFCKDTPAGRWYVEHYGNIVGCRINLTVDQVFDLTNPTHRQMLEQQLSLPGYLYPKIPIINGHIHWQTFERKHLFSPPGIDEDLFKTLGFRGIVLIERIAGEQEAPEDILSIAVFDAEDVEVI